MSFLNKLKSAFGIAPEESDMEYEASETPRTPYINPFKENQTNEPATPSPAAAAEKKQESEDAEALALAKVNSSVIEKIITVLNATLPEYIKDCIDKEAETKYVTKLIGDTLSEYTTTIRQKMKDQAALEWDTERTEMQKKVLDSSKQMEEMTGKYEDVKNRAMSLDRQKIALNERIASLEARAETAEAEKEQYQLETKSLLNKLKVAAVNDQEISVLKEENATLAADNTKIRAELLNLKNTMAGEMAAKETEFKDTVERLTAENAELSEKLKDFMAKNSEDVRLQTIATLRDEISLMTSSLEAARAKAEAGNATIAGLNAQIETMKTETVRISNEKTELTQKLAKLKAELEAAHDTARTKEASLADTARRESEVLRQEIERQAATIEEQEEALSRLRASNEEMETYVTQLQTTIDNNKRLHEADEAKLKQEIEALHQQADQLRKEMAEPRKEPTKLIFDEESTPDEDIEKATLVNRPPKKEKEKPKAKSKKIISAIDYNSEYSDWLKTVPATTAIPIEEMPVEEEEPEPVPERKNRPEIASQMELF